MNIQKVIHSGGMLMAVPEGLQALGRIVVSAKVPFVPYP